MSVNSLSPKIKEFMINQGFTSLTDIQSKAIPLLLRNKNALLISSTGSGKTEAAVIPAFEKIIQAKSINKKGIIVLYITPLRALNRDILKRIVLWGEKLDLRVSVRHGDTTQSERTKQSKNPPDFLITTPETLQILLTGKKLREHLKNIEMIIVDEIHELVADKRGVQLSVALERVKFLSNFDFQRVGLSATVGSQQIVQDMIKGSSKNVFVIQSEQKKEYDLSIEINPENKTDKNLESKLMVKKNIVSSIRRIKNITHKSTSILTFVNTRQTAEVLSSRLLLFDKSPLYGVHHSSLSKNARIDVENKFKGSEIKNLICTSSMELGIDIGSVDKVIQFNSPRQASKLIQRIGRAGHSIHKKSKGIILCQDSNEALESAVLSKNMHLHKLESIDFYRNAYDVLANQIVGFLIEYKSTDINLLFKTFKSAYYYNDLSFDDLSNVINILVMLGIVWTDKNTIGLKKRSWTFFYNHLSMIPDQKVYNIKNVASKADIGFLDQKFVLEHFYEGSSFVMRGKTWKVITIDENAVFVEPLSRSVGDIPKWEGDLIPVTSEVAQDVGDLRKQLFSLSAEDALNLLINEYNVDKISAKTIIKDTKSNAFVFDSSTLLIEMGKNNIVINSFFGSKINEGFGLLLSSFLSFYLKEKIDVKTDPYRIWLMNTSNITENLISTIFQHLESEKVESHLKTVLFSSFLFKWHFLNVGKRFGIFGKNFQYSSANFTRILEIYKDSLVAKETYNEIFHEKIDVNGIKNIIEGLGSNRYNLKIKEVAKFTPFANSIIDRYNKKDYLKKDSIIEILSLFKNRIENTRIKLHCMACNQWNTTFLIKNLPKELICLNCNSKLFTIVYKDDESLLRKNTSNKRLTADEKKRIKELTTISNLILSHGKHACMALAAHGVGPRTAAKILFHPYESTEAFLSALIEAEKQFLRTRQYW